MAEKIRNLMYGYMIQNGSIVLNPKEAIEVKKIYLAYLSGQSYKSIAERLTKSKIEYLPAKSNWNKNRVKRILENPKYLGTATLLPMISEQEFSKVQQLINSKSEHIKTTNSETALLKGYVKCGCCGKILKKYRTHNKFAWICDCKVSITESQMNNEISRLIAKTKVLDTYVEENDTTASSQEIYFIKNTIKKEMSQETIDEDKIKKLIFAYAKAEYGKISTDKTYLINEITEVVNNEILSKINIITKITKQLSINTDGTITATLITGLKI